MMMVKSVRRLVLAGVTGVAVVIGGGAAAQQAQGQSDQGAPVALKPVIAVLDVSSVMAKAKAARDLAAQRERYVEVYQKDVAETEKELRTIDQDLVRQRATLAPEVLANRRQAFQDRVNAFQKQVQERRRNLERAFGAAMNTIQGTLIRVTKEVAEERGMNIVLYRSQTFLFDTDMDITDRVLAEVDKRLPSVSMQNPESLPPEAEPGDSGKAR